MDKGLAKYDRSIVIAYFFLAALGLINLLSATSPAATEGLVAVLMEPSHHFKSQALYFGLGSILFLIFSRLDYRLWERLALPIFVTAIVLLLWVLFFGREISGSKRWIQLGTFRFQVSEFGKLALVIMLAKYFHHEPFRGLYGLFELRKPLAILLVPLVLVFLEPDLGTCLFYTFLTASMILFIGVKPKTLLWVGCTAMVGGIFAYNFLLHDYQRDRILTFINPQHDPLGRGYHSIQSLIAIGSGRFAGKGYLSGSQSQLKFLPEQHTDFIFSVLAEEWGFMGCFVLLFLYFTLIISGILIASKAKDRFGAMLGVGIVSIFFWHIVINMGAVIGLLPITGITLPLFSYGGSSVLMLSVCLGILQSINLRRFMF